MSGEKDHLEQLFQEALAGQERLEHGAAAEPADAAAAAAAPTAGAVPAGDDQAPTAAAPTPAPDATEAAAGETRSAAGDEKTAPAPAKKSAAEALTEALIKAKQEAVQALEQTQHEAKSLHDRLLRVSADFDNFRKRSKKQTDDAIKFANEGMLRELLPVLDAFDRALAAIGSDDKSALAQGVQMVFRMFGQTFQRIGLQSFSAVGEAFDPNRHEAVEQVASPEHPAGMVVKEYQCGYLLHDRLLRPASVVVSMGAPAVVTPVEPAPAPTSDVPQEAAAGGAATSDATPGRTETAPAATEPAPAATPDAGDTSGGETPT